MVIYSEHGPFDDQLKWPAIVTISLQLVNQYGDGDHYSRDIECKTDREKVGRGFPLALIAVSFHMRIWTGTMTARHSI